MLDRFVVKIRKDRNNGETSERRSPCLHSRTLHVYKRLLGLFDCSMDCESGECPGETIMGTSAVVLEKIHSHGCNRLKDGTLRSDHAYPGGL